MRRHPIGYSSSWQVRHVRDGTYFPVVAFVSKDLVVLARKRDFSLEICEIRRDDNSTLTLQTVCILKLPSLHPSTRVRFHMRNRTPFASEFPPRLCAPTRCRSGARPRTPSSVSRSASGDMAGPALRCAGLPFGSTTARFASMPRKRRVPRASSRRQRSLGVRAASCGGWHPGWLIGSATRSRRLPFFTGRNGVPNRRDGVNAATISVIGKRWRACAVRSCT